jgi:hypothetical protein
MLLSACVQESPFIHRRGPRGRRPALPVRPGGWQRRRRAHLVRRRMAPQGPRCDDRLGSCHPFPTTQTRRPDPPLSRPVKIPPPQSRLPMPRPRLARTSRPMACRTRLPAVVRRKLQRSGVPSRHRLQSHQLDLRRGHRRLLPDRRLSEPSAASHRSHPPRPPSIVIPPAKRPANAI